MKISLEFLGCKLNQAEVFGIGQRMALDGYTVVPAGSYADIYIINTCTVTATADRKARQMVRSAKRRNPQARVIVTGCYAERAPVEIALLVPDITVVPNSQKDDIPRIISDGGALPDRKVAPSGIVPVVGRTRGLVKIQEGCHYRCAYCIVPLVRPEPCSVPADEVVARVCETEKEDTREVVLTGTEIGTYRDKDLTLEGLLRQLLLRTGIERLRISSLQPEEISRGLLNLWQDPRLCRHFHLSLQSGSANVLREMGRRYTPEQYAAAVALIRERLHGVAVTTDVICGFPGETAADFRESLEFCRRMGFARMHVFPYSARPGTAAAARKGQVAAQVKNQRVAEMLVAAREAGQEFCREQKGGDVAVLWEQQDSDVWSGYAGNYTKVYAEGGDLRNGDISKVHITDLYRDGLWGEVSLNPED
ncbi:tRNA (N(6)-L-threonylcarbamoyladenosine(37)-C(2))-methylthiotransferase MtaB [Chloroflexota bacterium]